MAHAISRFTVFRVSIFVVVMICSWATWFAQFPSTRSQNAVWLLWSSLALLFAWSFVLYKRERPLAWVCWLSLLGMILLGMILPSR